MDPPFTVTWVFPAANALGAPRDQGLDVLFSEPVDPATITSTSFTLVSASGPVQAVVIGIGSAATFRPPDTLNHLTSYIATLTTDVKSLSGKALEENHTWIFTTSDRTWTSTQSLEGEAGTVADHGLAANRVGTAIAFWRQVVNGEQGIYLHPFSPQPDWTGPFKLDPVGGGLAYAPQVSVDDSGNIVAIWLEIGATAPALWSRRYRVGTGWEDAQELAPSVSPDDDVDLALGPTGLGYVAYLRWVIPGNYGEVLRRHDPQTGWQAEEFYAGLTTNGDAAVTNASGRTLHAYSDYNPATGPENGKSRTIEPGSGWSGWTSGIGLFNPNVLLSTMDDSGNVILMWEVGEFTGTEIISWSRYNWGGTWSGNTTINPAVGSAHYPAIAGIGSGRVRLVWEHLEDGQSTIRIAGYDPGTGWIAPSLLNPTAVNPEGRPSISMDAQGRVLVAWSEYQGRWIIRARLSSAAGVWSATATAASDAVEATFDSKVHLLPDGRAIAVALRGTAAPYDLVFSRLE